MIETVGLVTLVVSLIYIIGVVVLITMQHFSRPPAEVALEDPRLTLRRLRREQMKRWDDEFYRLLPPTPIGHPESCNWLPIVQDEYVIHTDEGRPDEVVTIARCLKCGWSGTDRTVERPFPLKVNNGFLSLYRAGYSLEEIREIEKRMHWNRWEQR